MQVRVWGCRGSVAAPGPDTLKYGGNTSCIEVRLSSGEVLVLDAGTGLRPLGVVMQSTRPPELHILLSHLHLDHLQGLGFFRPLFNPDLEIHIWGPPSPVQPLSERIVADLESRNMAKGAPILLRIFKEESELEVWKIDGTGRFACCGPTPSAAGPATWGRSFNKVTDRPPRDSMPSRPT